MSDLVLYPPAKINLSLRVLGKREDGFHELDTLMLPVGLTDELHFTQADTFGFSCDEPGVPVDENNLVVKAVRIFERETGLEVRHHIHLLKNIPHGAGLGGGSSDAAFTLKGLNTLYQTDLDCSQLAALGSELGSDVPFFLYETLCRCTGRGEIVQPENKSFQAPVLLLKPPFSVSTPDAYRRWKGSRELENVRYSAQEWRGCYAVNDLERPVFEKYIFLSTLKMCLLGEKGVEVVLMSGSGSTLFVLCHSSESSEKIARNAKKTFPDLWIWSGVTH